MVNQTTPQFCIGKDDMSIEPDDSSEPFTHVVHSIGSPVVGLGGGISSDETILPDLEPAGGAASSGG